MSANSIAALANAVSSDPTSKPCRWYEGIYYGPCVCDTNLSKVQLPDSTIIKHVAKLADVTLNGGETLLLLQITPAHPLLIVGVKTGDTRRAEGCEAD